MDAGRLTRRQLLKYTAVGGTAGLVAGCASRPEPQKVQLYKSGTPTEGIGAQPDETFDAIQPAVDAAFPGDVIKVPPGVYREKVTTVRSGTKEEPIVLTGPESAVLTGNENDYGVLRIHHSNFHFVGFTVNGLLNSNQPNRLSSYVPGQLIQTRPLPTTDEYLEGIIISPHKIGFSRKSLIGIERTKDSEIGPCKVIGLAGAEYIIGDAESHNGELLYIGTSYSNLGTDWHPWTDFDETRNVRIHHIDNSDGHPHAEAVDLKEGTRDITVEYMTDRNGGQVGTDDVPSVISFKSHNSTVRWCEISDAPIAVEFHGSFTDQIYGNDLYGCKITNFGQFGIYYGAEAVGPEVQGILCGNQIEGFDQLQPDVCSFDVPPTRAIGYDDRRARIERRRRKDQY